MTDQNFPLIQTMRCILRLPELAEAGLMYDFVASNKQHLSKWEPLQEGSYYTEEYWQNKTTQIHDDFLSDKSCCLNIYTKEDNRLIGIVNYSNFVRGCFHSCFLGFKISEDMQRKGIITECLQVSIAYVFDELNLHRISANYMPSNKASARVLEKCEFKKEGVAEDYLYINGKWEGHVLTSLINKKWVKQNDK
ncbi:MAG: GNAT family N-acetyltransferase [Proteobacteria bacterium]|nr:GNAT family N-acetyltransferase [Pseudomonadota bacterium]